MLLEFKAENFKSFRDEFVFFMQPQSRMTELSHSILRERITNRDIKALSTSVIYGPNAAGKTSVVNAMSCLRQIILRGNIRDTDGDKSGDHVSREMTLIPFRGNKKNRPVTFDITFTYHSHVFRYKLSFSLGRFLEKQRERFINHEELLVDHHTVFERTGDGVRILNTSSIADRLNVGYNSSDDEATREKLGENLTNDTIMLTTDFNSFCSKKIVAEIAEWFSKRFIVLNSSNLARFYPSIPNDEKVMVSSELINQIADEAGIFGSEIVYMVDEKTRRPKLVSLLTKRGDRAIGIDADQIESVGTLRLVSVIPIIIAALQHGATLVIDEFDASLHPNIIMNILSVFHNDEVNKNRAQIIFNTHNPMYLNNRLMRRDEIKFVERDENSGGSQLYALSDFKTNNGAVSVRKTSDYMKNYFVNRYGAIVDVDFTDIFIAAINSKRQIDGR